MSIYLAPLLLLSFCTAIHAQDVATTSASIGGESSTSQVLVLEHGYPTDLSWASTALTPSRAPRMTIDGQPASIAGWDIPNRLVWWTTPRHSTPPAARTSLCTTPSTALTHHRPGKSTPPESFSSHDVLVNPEQEVCALRMGAAQDSPREDHGLWVDAHLLRQGPMHIAATSHSDLNTQALLNDAKNTLAFEHAWVLDALLAEPTKSVGPTFTSSQAAVNISYQFAVPRSMSDCVQEFSGWTCTPRITSSEVALGAGWSFHGSWRMLPSASAVTDRMGHTNASCQQQRVEGPNILVVMCMSPANVWYGRDRNHWDVRVSWSSFDTQSTPFAHWDFGNIPRRYLSPLWQYATQRAIHITP